MRKTSMILLAVAFAFSALPGFAQTSPKTTKSPKTTRTAKTPKTKSTKTIATSDKTTGMVSGEAKNNKFTFANGKGRYTVDATSAKCTYNGKAYSVNSLKGGNGVTVYGKVSGTSIKATEIKVNFVRLAAGTAKKVKTIRKAKTATKTVAPKIKPMTTKKTGGN